MLRIYFETVSCESVAKFDRGDRVNIRSQSLISRETGRGAARRVGGLFPRFGPRNDTSDGSVRRPRSRIPRPRRPRRLPERLNRPGFLHPARSGSRSGWSSPRTHTARCSRYARARERAVSANADRLRRFSAAVLPAPRRRPRCAPRSSPAVHRRRSSAPALLRARSAGARTANRATGSRSACHV
jgi:hypothetical protein